MTVVTFGKPQFAFFCTAGITTGVAVTSFGIRFGFYGGGNMSIYTSEVEVEIRI